MAHAAATTSLLSGGRFFLGVGTGENLNEHVLGDRWARPEVRLAQLDEAIAVMRAAWEGDTVDHDGQFYEVENLRIFDPPTAPIPVIVSAFGTMAAELAGRVGDGMWGHAPDADVMGAYERAGGSGPRHAQLNLCWSEDAAAARRTVLDLWPNGAIPGQLAQDLPTWTHFEQAAALVSEEAATRSVPCGPDPGPLLESVQRYVEAGYTHPVLPPDRCRPGRLLPLLGRRAGPGAGAGGGGSPAL